MKKPHWINDGQVRKKLTPRRKLPPEFDSFVAAVPQYRIEWNRLESFSLKRSAHDDALPFMCMPTGGVVALWYYATTPAVVYFGDEGELKVLAVTFSQFLKGLATRKSGLPDFDEADEPFRVSGVKGSGRTGVLPKLQKSFNAWYKRHTSLQQPLRSAETEQLRKKVHAVATRMLADGKSKVYRVGAEWWTMDFEIKRVAGGVRVSYLDYGKWLPVPKQYGLVPLAKTLLALVKNKRKRSYDLSTGVHGIVSIDRDRELVLMPPKK